MHVRYLIQLQHVQFCGRAQIALRSLTHDRRQKIIEGDDQVDLAGAIQQLTNLRSLKLHGTRVCCTAVCSSLTERASLSSLTVCGQWSEQEHTSRSLSRLCGLSNLQQLSMYPVWGYPMLDPLDTVFFDKLGTAADSVSEGVLAYGPRQLQKMYPR